MLKTFSRVGLLVTVLASGCAFLDRFLTRTVPCVTDASLEGWLGSRLNGADWTAVHTAPKAGSVLGTLITCGLTGLADAFSQDVVSSTARPRETRAHACVTGPCDSARERAAAVLLQVVPASVVRVPPGCREADTLTVRWLNHAVVTHPELAKDILTTPYGQELELALIEVANSGEPAAAERARAALRKNRSRCVSP